MSGRKQVIRGLLASLVVLVCVGCVSSIASADVDMTGKIAPGPALKSGLRSPGLGAAPLVNSEHDGVYHCSDAYSTIANVAGGLAIGNCPLNEEFDVEDYGSGGEKSGYFYGGYFANVGACAWVKISEALKAKSGNLGHCSGGIGYAYGTFYSQINSGSAEDGFYVNNGVACEEYANVYPWSADTAAGPIRNVPAYTESHENKGYPALKWRYVTNNGKYVMVRDATVGGGEGNWVFVERSCLPATLPSGSEELPPKPTLTTAGASGVATPNATLNATVNPNGVDTKYFFEYGTTESYGSYTSTQDAGTGTSGVAVNAALTGLAPGTTYYFRIVASSATGETFGGPVAFTTQPPPTVTTNAASEVQQEQVTLNGKINPHGLNAIYRFEYGTTTGYGTSTLTGETGLGVESEVSVSLPITGLIPGTTYYYRIVATSSAGTSEGTGQVVTTVPRTRPAVVRETNNEQWAYYIGTNGNLWSRFFNPSPGEWVALHAGSGEAAAPGGSPAVVRDANNEQWVYYTGANGNIWARFFNPGPGEWVTFHAGSGEAAAPGTSPAAIREPNNEQWVFYTGANKNIWGRFYNPGPGEWVTFNAGSGEAAAPGTSPAAVRDASTGNEWVYYIGTNRNIWGRFFNAAAGTWVTFNAGSGEAAAPGTSPTVVREASNSNQWVYYTGINGNIWGRFFNAAAGTWVTFNAGSGEAVALGTSPSVVRETNNEQWVYYTGANGNIWARFFNPGPGEWVTFHAGSGEAAAPGTSPSAVREPNNEQWVFYAGANGNIWGRFFNPGPGEWVTFNAGSGESW